jgi:protein SCO1/2
VKKIVYILIVCALCSCNQKQKKLPFLGNPIVANKDTLYPKIKEFSFLNQNNLIVNNRTFENKIYIADFIFLSCPTICPKMHVELKSVYETYRNNPNVLFLSHTIDPEHDTVERLKEHTTNNNLDSNKWHFVTGNRDSIYDLATKSYFGTAYKDAKELGGYVHSGGFLLIDKNRFIRGVYDGTNPEETKRLIMDVKSLLSE